MELPSPLDLAARPSSMRAAQLARRGGPERIVVGVAPIPPIAADDALVAVRAAAITPSELGWEPTWTRPDGTDRTPVIPSHEVAGVVVETGDAVTEPAIGQPVLALTDFFRNGAAAEFVAVRAETLAEWPTALPPETAAALPLSGLTAWQALFDHGHLLAGERVLIYGAAGGVGTFAVQLAHLQAAYVIAVASTRDADLLRSLGADVVLDRHAPSLEVEPGSIDVIVDTVGGDVLDRSWPLLAETGRLVSIAPGSRTITDRDERGRFFVVSPDSGVLDELARLTERGELRVIVERTFPLEATRQAFEFAQRAHPRGKVVLRVG